MDEIKKRLGDITGAISWRQQDIKYRKNEIFIDVVEKVNVLLSPKGTILESVRCAYKIFLCASPPLVLLSLQDVSGCIQIKCYLSGMPECRFGMNDKLLLESEAKKSGVSRKRKNAIQLDDVSFHQCVKVRERALFFVAGSRCLLTS